MDQYLGATIPLQGGLFGRSQGLLDTVPFGADPTDWQRQQDAFMRSYAVDPSLYRQFAPPAEEPAPTTPAAAVSAPVQAAPVMPAREGGYLGGFLGSGPSSAGFLGGMLGSAGAGVGLLTGAPGLGLLGTGIGLANDYNYGQRLANQAGFSFDPSIMSALGNSLSFGLFGDSIENQLYGAASDFEQEAAIAKAQLDAQAQANARQAAINALGLGPQGGYRGQAGNFGPGGDFTGYGGPAESYGR